MVGYPAEERPGDAVQNPVDRQCERGIEQVMPDQADTATSRSRNRSRSGPIAPSPSTRRRRPSRTSHTARQKTGVRRPSPAGCNRARFGAGLCGRAAAHRPACGAQQEPGQQSSRISPWPGPNQMKVASYPLDRDHALNRDDGAAPTPAPKPTGGAARRPACVCPETISSALPTHVCHRRRPRRCRQIAAAA